MDGVSYTVDRARTKRRKGGSGGRQARWKHGFSAKAAVTERRRMRAHRGVRETAEDAAGAVGGVTSRTHDYAARTARRHAERKVPRAWWQGRDKTEQRERCRLARWKHGFYAKAAVKARRAMRKELLPNRGPGPRTSAGLGLRLHPR